MVRQWLFYGSNSGYDSGRELEIFFSISLRLTDVSLRQTYHLNMIPLIPFDLNNMESI